MAANFYGSPVRGDESEDESHLEEDDSHSEAVEVSILDSNISFHTEQRPCSSHLIL